MPSEKPPRSKRKTRDKSDPKERRSKKGAITPKLLALILGGGLVALLLCAGCGTGGYFLIFRGRPGGPIPGVNLGAITIEGKWVSNNAQAKWHWDFNNGKGVRVAKENYPIPGKAPFEITSTFDYKFTPGDPGILEISNCKSVGGTEARMFQIEPGQSKRFTVESKKGMIFLENVNGGERSTLQRK